MLALESRDAHRAREVIARLHSHGLRCALTGSLAVNAHLHARGHRAALTPLHDIDLVVSGFDAIPDAVAAGFLVNHVHPRAVEGKLLLQLIDASHVVRVDLFRAFGSSLSRVVTLDGEDSLELMSVEDLAARATAHVAQSIRDGDNIDPKYVGSFNRLRNVPGLVETNLRAAWSDHRQNVAGTWEEAVAFACERLTMRPQLVVADSYSAEITACPRCVPVGPFRPAPPQRIVELLGYW